MKELLIAGILITACGGESESKESIPEEVAAVVYSSAQGGNTGNLYLTKLDLPTCDESRKSHLAYVDDELSFYGCDGNEWRSLAVSNNAEVVGLENINCFFDHSSTDSAYMGFNYSYTKFSNGTASAQVSLYGLYDETSSNTLFWGADSIGAELGFVNILMDYYVNEITLSEDHTTLIHKQIDPQYNETKEYTMSTSDPNCSVMER